MNQTEIKKIAKFIAQQWTEEKVAGSEEIFYDRLPQHIGDEKNE